MRELMDDLGEKYFLLAIRDVARNLKEIFPNTNLIAHIRERALEIKKSMPIPPPMLEIPMSQMEIEKNRAIAKIELKKLAEKLGMRFLGENNEK